MVKPSFFMDDFNLHLSTKNQVIVNEINIRNLYIKKYAHLHLCHHEQLIMIMNKYQDIENTEGFYNLCNKYMERLFDSVL